MSPLYIDHMFTSDKAHRFLKSLKKRGFSLVPNAVEHPGKVFCRFIPLQGKVGRKQTYLEFADVRDPKTKFVNSGLSFGFVKGLEKQVPQWTRQGLGPNFHHKNYEWKKDDKSRLPGWNFVDFSNSGIRSYFPWITEYEPWRKRKKLEQPKHKNTVYKLIDVEVSATSKAKSFYKKLLGQKRVFDQTTLRCNTQLTLKPAASNQFRRVILACKDLDSFEKYGRPDDWKSYKGREAGVIKNPNPKSWDIWVIQD